jgi:hypothetical protein
MFFFILWFGCTDRFRSAIACDDYEFIYGVWFVSDNILIKVLADGSLVPEPLLPAVAVDFAMTSPTGYYHRAEW